MKEQRESLPRNGYRQTPCGSRILDIEKAYYESGRERDYEKVHQSNGVSETMIFCNVDAGKEVKSKWCCKDQKQINRSDACG